MIVVAPAVLLLPFALWFLVDGQPLADSMTRLLDLDDPTPLGLAYLNLSLAAAIPLTWFVVRVVHGLRPGWLASVQAADPVGLPGRLHRRLGRGADRDAARVGGGPLARRRRRDQRPAQRLHQHHA